jgi:hypothetical protein
VTPHRFCCILHVTAAQHCDEQMGSVAGRHPRRAGAAAAFRSQPWTGPSSGEPTANLTSEDASYRWPSGFQDKLKGLAAAENCTPAQLALAWVLSRARHIVPIPGTSHRHRLMLPPLNEATRYRFSEELLPLRG